MKLLKLTLFAVLLFTMFSLTSTGAHRTAASGQIALAAEPASWLLVAIGIVGGGFLHKRRLPGVNLVAPSQTPSPAPSPVAISTLRPSSRKAHLELLASLRVAHGHLRNSGVAFLSPRVVCSTFACALLLLFNNTALADTINLSSAPVSSLAFSPSSDTFSLQNGSVAVGSTAGPFTFQTGDFVVGDSEIPDQNITFSFQDTLTLNGITKTLTFYGQDAVTQSADTLTISGGAPVAFGNDLLTVRNFSLSETNLGDFSVNLQATASSTPEPSSLLLVGSGLVCSALLMTTLASAKKS